MTAFAASPATVAELVDAVHSARRAIAVGAGTKPRMAKVGEDVARIGMTRLSGILEYEPSEFTFTALAGTPVNEIAATLAERGQYLPFDPLLAEAGTTLGGTVAAGLSGPGRFRFGGVRDFILGVRFVDGEGRLLRMGGKVVKNAAGFDLPKFFVGSAGRLGVLAELTFKVFPRAATTKTLRLEATDTAELARMVMALGRGRWEVDALDAPLAENAVHVRLAGPAAALEALAQEIFSQWPGQAMEETAAAAFWRNARELDWAHADGVLAKVALTPERVPEFRARVHATESARGWMSAGGNVGYVSVPAGAPLPKLDWPAVTLRGDAALWPGVTPRFEIMRAVKTALDPQKRFPDLDE